MPAAMNRRGGVYDMRPTRPRMGTLDHEGSTTAIPFIIGTDGWGLFVHSPQDCLFNLGGPGSEDGMEGMCERRSGTGWDLFVIDGAGDASPNYSGLAGVVRAYYELTGRPPLPPKYAFGYQQSHRELRLGNVDFRQATTDFFRDTGFPCDLLIYLSSGLAGASGWNTGMGEFAFNKTVFPDPANDLAALQEAHFRVALHTHLCPEDLHGTIHDADAAAADTGHAKNYWARHAAVLDTGPVHGWWPDGGDDLSIDSRLLRHQMYWEGSLQNAPDTRPFALHRTGYASVWRYPTAPGMACSMARRTTAAVTSWLTRRWTHCQCWCGPAASSRWGVCSTTLASPVTPTPTASTT
jgi:alpha-glucosidase (family GH31 glycosyl hydrolase)